MAGKIDFANVFGKLGQARSRMGFDIQFRAIERTFINRINKEIDEATDDGTAERLAEYDRQRKEIGDHVERAREYRFGLETNEARFREIAATSAKAVNSYGASSSLTADEAANLNALRDEAVENIKRLKLLRFPDFSDGEVTSRLRQYVDDLEALTAEAGTVDGVDADPDTYANDNRALINLLENVSNDALNFADTTLLVQESVNGFLIDAQTDLFEIEAEATELTQVQLEENTRTADEIKLKYSTLLKAISLSFEVSSQVGDMLNKGVSPPPEKGSILNLFT